MEENSEIELTDTDVKPTFMFSEDILRPDEICNSKNLNEDGTRLEYMEHCLMDDNYSMEATKILDTFCLTENNDEAFDFQRFLEESFDFKQMIVPQESAEINYTKNEEQFDCTYAYNQQNDLQNSETNSKIR
uniref:Uncharacterized protein n=1 Tax=Solanum tuberosum TaxID=4113 RepID=M1BAV5_SOLTU